MALSIMVSPYTLVEADGEIHQYGNFGVSLDHAQCEVAHWADGTITLQIGGRVQHINGDRRRYGDDELMILRGDGMEKYEGSLPDVWSRYATESETRFDVQVADQNFGIPVDPDAQGVPLELKWYQGFQYVRGGLNDDGSRLYVILSNRYGTRIAERIDALEQRLDSDKTLTFMERIQKVAPLAMRDIAMEILKEMARGNIPYV